MIQITYDDLTLADGDTRRDKVDTQLHVIIVTRISKWDTLDGRDVEGDGIAKHGEDDHVGFLVDVNVLIALLVETSQIWDIYMMTSSCDVI